MNNTHNEKLTPNAKTLRKNLTKEERHLWYDCFKKLPVTVHRQKVLGKYIVDFYVASKKLVIELDGSQHYEDDNKAKDEERDRYLEGLGLQVVRYTNLDVNTHFEAVCQDIYRRIYEE